MRRDHPARTTARQGKRGQALTEYALILVLVIIALAGALWATGPAIGNVFSDAVLAAIGERQDRLPPGGGVDEDGNPISAAEAAATNFWATVNALEEQDPFIPPDEQTLEPTLTPEGFELIPTATATDLPPTPSVIPSATVAPTETPVDRSWELPFEDVVEERPEDDRWYRLTSNTYLGQNAWTARNYQDGPEGTPLSNVNLRSFDSFDANTSRFIFPGYDIPRIEERFFSVQLRREIQVYGEDANLSFRLRNPTGGVRVYYQDEGGCEGFAPTDNSRDAVTDSPCMILDEWAGPPPTSATATQLFNFAGNPGNPESKTDYVIFVEFYHLVSAPNLELAVTSSKFSPDDTGLNNTAVDCNWGVYEGPRTNTRPYSWNSAVGINSNNFPDNQRCHLELRGYVDLSDTASYALNTTPVLMFWSIWDLNPNTTVELEVAEYPAVLPPDWSPADLNWQDTGWSLASGTRNYEWTKAEVPLDQNGLNFDTGDYVSYRFVMQNIDGGGGRKRFYVDDIQIGNQPLPNLAVQNPGGANTLRLVDFVDNNDPANPAPLFWDFDTAGRGSLVDFTSASNPTGGFVGTGRWEIASAGAFAGNAIVNDPDQPYSLEPGASTGTEPLDRRIYQLEFAKRIDVSDTTVNGLSFRTTAAAPADADGDAGAPILSFFHSYSLRDNAALQVEYYDDDANDWRLLREVIRTQDRAEAFNSSPVFVQVPLNEREVADANGYGTGTFEGYADGWTAWADGPIRIRFSMVVNEDAIDSAEGSWAIDDILLERLGSFSYTPYPIADSAGDAIEGNVDADLNDTLDRWRRSGAWNVVERDGYTGDNLFTDSPNSEYTVGSDSALTLRSPLDLNSDTASNPFAQTCDANLPTVSQCDAVRQAPAVDPVVTFWWYRDLGNGSRFTVEARDEAGAGAPITLWEYNYSSNNGTQPAWERVEIDLDPFIDLDATDTNTLSDDIVLSFRLVTGNDPASAASGVWLDDIRVEDRPTAKQFKLWSGTGINGVTGNGVRYVDSIDDRTNISNNGVAETEDDGAVWWRRWHRGGNWFSDIYIATSITGINNSVAADVTQSTIARSGSQVFHESPNLIDVPYSFDYEVNSFNVLEMQRTIDMTGLNADRQSGISTGGTVGDPIMYWWQRQDRGRDARLLVQIASRGGNLDNDPLTYGADELAGWSNWETVYISDNNGGRDYAWRRLSINLKAAPIYNGNGSQIGTRNYLSEEIRVRFVLDATNVEGEADARDGWYIDDVEFTVQTPTIFELPFVDNAQSMANWVGEGTWGLDAATFRGGAEIPSITGSAWTAQYLNCTRRPNNGNQRTSNSDCNRDRLSDVLTDYNDYRQYYGDDSVNDDDRWYVTEDISALNFERSFNSDYGGRPPGAPNRFDWNNDFAAEFQRTLTITDPYRYQVYARSDDGVRVGITPFPSTADIRLFPSTSEDTNIPVASNTYTDPAVNGGQPVPYNNIIDQWRDQAPTVVQGAVTLVPNEDGSPRDYLLTVHYFENSGGADFAFGLSGSRASFADSPLSVPPREDAADISYIPANHLSNTSLQLDGLLDLVSATEPLISYYTKYDMQGISATAYLEVSEDGGFNWTRNDLTGTIGTQNANSPTSWSGSSTSGRDDEWQQRFNTLEDYRGEFLSLRFRLDVDADLNDQINALADGVYISDVLVYDQRPTAPQPQIIINPPLSLFVSTDDIANGEQQISVVATGTQPLVYEWFQGEPPVGYAGDAGTTPPGNISVGGNSSTLTLPDNLDPDRYTFWVRIHNTVSIDDPDVPPAVSIPTRVRVADCVAVNVGDCDIYRLNLNGNDMASRDGSQPDWAGTRNGQSADNISIGGNSFNRSDNRIALDSFVNNDFIRSASAGPAPEDVYETYRETGSEMSFSLPVEPGEYSVRLYMADPGNSNNQGNFTVNINDGQGGFKIARYQTAGTAQPLQNIDFFDLIGQNNQVGALVELEAVTVSPQADALNLKIINESNQNTMVSAVEVFPVTDLDPIIVQEPQDIRVAEGGTATLQVIATGANLQFEWYQGATGDTSTPLTTDPANVGGLSGNSALEVVNVTGSTQYWVRILGGPDPASPITVDSRTATIQACNQDPAVYGSCDNYFLNLAGTGTAPIDASDGTRWYSSDDTSDIRVRDFSNMGWGYAGGNVQSSHVPSEVFDTFRQATDFSYDFNVLNGFYDITIYVADRENNPAQRAMDITVEDRLLADDFHPITSGIGDDIYHSITFEDVEVIDGNLQIDFERYSTDGRAVRVSAIEVKPAGS